MEELKFDEQFIKNYNEGNDKGFSFDVDIDYPKQLYNLDIDLPRLPKRMKLNKYGQILRTLYDKENYIFHIKKLK